MAIHRASWRRSSAACASAACPRGVATPRPSPPLRSRSA